MEKMGLDDFIKYAKEQFDCEILIKPDNNPDTFAGVFGASFIENNEGSEKVRGFECDLNYENATIEVRFDIESDMSDIYSGNVGLAA